MESICILLREVRPGTDQAYKLAEVHEEVRREEKDGLVALDLERAFQTFLQRASSVPPRQHQDIYIGFWGNQTTFQLTPEFSQFASMRSAPITIDFND